MADVASYCGFMDLSELTADYGAEFGDAPIETLLCAA
ncbi:AraC family transcriptional regulator [Amycolatopsis alkalitolerans]|uniref:AraC family transcriptional regulator n=1 Tax=Amycolatopsis alkalitolerans TaxID=2547244 RepID=A0A5C4LWC7_9PSEU|nr:AraC family transcriptional regulator [Amycolatopsis alkalitolerans]